MAYIYGNRYQTGLFPQSVEDYVTQEDPVRAYDAFVESLDLSKLGITYKEVQVGNPEYNPKAMLKLLIYGYSYGIRSSRKLERACYHNISFIWLMEGLKPGHRTIGRFRKDNKEPLKNIFKQCAKLCIKLGLIEGNTLFVDGSKIRANASINSTWTKEKCERHLANIDERIESINSTDPECVNVKGRQGTHAGYNSQIVVDEKHGLIVNSDVVNKSNDRDQFAGQIEQANETLGKKCETACADAGYANTQQLKKIDEQNINVIVPSQEQESNKESELFNKNRFEYDSKDDCYVCPQGNTLRFSTIQTDKRQRVYRITSKLLCLKCQFFGACTKDKKGRTISRLIDEETKLKLENNYKTEQSQLIYKLRKQKVELPFGHIKRNLGVSSFLIKGLEGVKAEMSILSSCFNIARLITILGVSGFIKSVANA